MSASQNNRKMPLGRAVIVRRLREDGARMPAAADAFQASTRTVRKWLARFCHIGYHVIVQRIVGRDQRLIRLPIARNRSGEVVPAFGAGSGRLAKGKTCSWDGSLPSMQA